MKKPRGFLAALLSGLLLLPPAAVAQGFQVGQIVTTNFSLGNRYRWTNDINGQVFLPNTTFRLSDFDGKIVFFVFYDHW